MKKKFDIQKEKELINIVFDSFSFSQKKEWYLNIIKNPEEFIYSLWEGGIKNIDGINKVGKDNNIYLLEEIQKENLLPKDIILKFFELQNNRKTATEIYIEEIRNNLMEKYKKEEIDKIKNQSNLEDFLTFYNDSVMFLKNNTK